MEDYLISEQDAHGERAETEQLFQVKRMVGGIGNTLFSIFFSNLEWVRSKGFIGELHVGSSWSAELAMTHSLASVCTFKTSPCNPANTRTC